MSKGNNNIKTTEEGNKKTFCCACSKYWKYLMALPFVVVWLLLVSVESATLFRVSEQSLFLFSEHFFTDAMALPGGLLSYLGTFFIQFFHYPALGATIYVGLLYLLYVLTKKVFSVPGSWNLLALLPVALVLACSTQLGYWIFYIKVQGFYYMPLLGCLVSLLPVWLCNHLRPGYRNAVVFLWPLLTFPLFGVYSLAASVVMAVASLASTIKEKRGVLFGVIAILLAACAVYSVPLWYYYKVYSVVAVEHIHYAGLPIHQWVTYSEKMYPNGIMEYWVPFIMLPVVYCLLAVLKSLFGARKCASECLNVAVQASLAVAMVVFSIVYWYKDTNFSVENKQNVAMWNEDWEAVSEYSRECDVPTRQVVLNKNMALLKLGRAGEDAFKYPDGSADINHPGAVHLTQTGGMMNYFQYGKFNFCYRWCIENSVEYGWRAEYLKLAVRSMLLSGQHKLAMRYINILKHTLFYRSWAEEMEKMVKQPSLISKQPEFKMPLLMYSYSDVLDQDESYVEVYLSNNMINSYTSSDSWLYAESAVLHAMIRKDVNSFWQALARYVSKGQLTRVPHHFQEAIELFTNLSKDISTNIPIDRQVKKRFEAFLKKTQQYKGMSEAEMAPYFAEEYGDTYWYFYFFVREIKTN